MLEVPPFPRLRGLQKRTAKPPAISILQRLMLWGGKKVSKEEAPAGFHRPYQLTGKDSLREKKASSGRGCPQPEADAQGGQSVHRIYGTGQDGEKCVGLKSRTPGGEYPLWYKILLAGRLNAHVQADRPRRGRDAKESKSGRGALRASSAAASKEVRGPKEGHAASSMRGQARRNSGVEHGRGKPKGMGGRDEHRERHRRAP